MYGIFLLSISLAYELRVSFTPPRTNVLAVHNTTTAGSTEAREVYCSWTKTRTSCVGLCQGAAGGPLLRYTLSAACCREEGTAPKGLVLAPALVPPCL